jgi:phosphatidylglycerophosphate synthase
MSSEAGLRHLPNLISSLRLLCAPVLIWLTVQGLSDVFAWILIAAWLSDLADGWLARSFGWVSRIGAMLDSVADIALTLATLYGIWVFHNDVFAVHGWLIWLVLGLWVTVNSIALVRYGRPASFHARLAQVGMALFGVFVLTLFFYDFVGWIYYLCGAVCLAAGVENLAMIYLLNDWTPNVRGGLMAALRRRQGER